MFFPIYFPVEKINTIKKNDYCNKYFLFQRNLTQSADRNVASSASNARLLTMPRG